MPHFQEAVKPLEFISLLIVFNNISAYPSLDNAGSSFVPHSF